MLNDLKHAVCKANKELAKFGLVKHTMGNVSAFDTSMGLFVIKPSGVPYEELQPEMMVVMSMEGTKVEGRHSPSIDAETHRAIYMKWPFEVGAIVHTHSLFATIFAQSCMEIPAYGATHADTFYGNVPVTRKLSKAESDDCCEYNTGVIISELIKNPQAMPAVLVAQHGPFVWGKNCKEAIHNAVILEEVAQMAIYSKLLSPSIEVVDQHVLDKHYLRRQGVIDNRGS